MQLSQGDIKVVVEELLKLSVEYAPKIIGSIVTLVVGFLIIKFISKLIKNALVKTKIDETLQPFFITLIKVTLQVVLIVSVMGILGVQVASFAAIIGAVGLAFGMSLSGTLQNFAGGAIVLIMKPFKKGDFVSLSGYEGFVEEIQIFNTIIKTLDNKVVIIPNSEISNKSMINFTHESKRMSEFVFGVSYGTDFDFVKQVLLDIIAQNSNIYKEPAPFIVLSQLADSSVNILVRIWTDTSKQWDVYYWMMEKVYKTFNEKNIEFPFPQMDVHVSK